MRFPEGRTVAPDDVTVPDGADADTSVVEAEAPSENGASRPRKAVKKRTRKKRAAKKRTAKKAQPKKAAAGQQAKFPRHSVERALRIPKAIYDQNGGNAATLKEAVTFSGGTSV